MVDSTQLIIAFVILALTTMLSVVGLQIFFILREFRKTLAKANKILDDTGIISESVSKPVSMLSGVLVGLRGGSKIVQSLTKNERK